MGLDGTGLALPGRSAASRDPGRPNVPPRTRFSGLVVPPPPAPRPPALLPSLRPPLLLLPPNPLTWVLYPPDPLKLPTPSPAVAYPLGVTMAPGFPAFGEGGSPIPPKELLLLLLPAAVVAALRAWPSSTWAARDAKLSDDRVSPDEAASGERLHTSSTLLVPHKLSCRTWGNKQSHQLKNGLFQMIVIGVRKCKPATSRISIFVAKH